MTEIAGAKSSLPGIAINDHRWDRSDQHQHSPGIVIIIIIIIIGIAISIVIAGIAGSTSSALAWDRRHRHHSLGTDYHHHGRLELRISRGRFTVGISRTPSSAPLPRMSSSESRHIVYIHHIVGSQERRRQKKKETPPGIGPQHLSIIHGSCRGMIIITRARVRAGSPGRRFQGSLQTTRARGVILAEKVTFGNHYLSCSTLLPELPELP